MIFQNVGTTIPLVIQTLILAAFLVVAIIAIMARDTVQAIGDEVKTKVGQHKATHVDVEMLYASCSNAELKAKLRKLSETIRYSDPMTNDAIADVEQRIQQKISELRIYSENDETAEAIKTCSALELLYVERNKKLLISK
jgi:putative ubiquitin-RnfH superfamily antitoxin RatB of RatAB toxin-antitoxin module